VDQVSSLDVPDVPDVPLEAVGDCLIEVVIRVNRYCLGGAFDALEVAAGKRLPHTSQRLDPKLSIKY